MGFESGSISFSMLYYPRRFPADAVERFAAHAAPPIETLSREEIHGWVTGRHLLDRRINGDSAHFAGYLRLTLMKAVRKIPEALLRAECKMEELAEMEARGSALLPRNVRAEIKKGVVERLLPAMPPTLTGIPIVYDGSGDTIYAAATNERQLDALTLALRETLGVSPAPVVPETASLQRRKASIRDLARTSFSPERDDSEASDSIGQDFLTWLWFFSEVRGGLIGTEAGEFGVAIDGPLLFVLEGGGAHEMVLRKGTPLVSSEAKTALLAGKKLRRARITLARGEETWAAAVDAETFTFRGVRLPGGEQVDPISRFQERMLALDVFRDAFLACFDRFLEERLDEKAWRKTQQEIQRWVSERRAQP